MTVKGVIVAAGYGTRFLPVTRCIPKEMLPIVDRPAIDFIAQEFEEAGIQEVLVITSRRKKVMEDWFDRDVELETLFEREGATEKLRRARPRSLSVHFIRQRQMSGTGDAILLARTFAGRDPVLVAYPDDLFGQPNCSATLIKTHRATGCSVLAAADFTGRDVSRYGVLDVVPDGPWTRLRRFVEKPPAGTEPSSLVSLGRFLLTPDFFEALAEGRERHTQGEYFHVGAIEALAAQRRMMVQVITAPRYDTGEPLGYLQAVIEEGLRRPDLGPALRAWLERRLADPSPR